MFISIGLSGCQTAGGPGSEGKPRKDNTVLRKTAEGAVVGALVRGGLAAATGGDVGDAMLEGAIAGAIIGNINGRAIRDKNIAELRRLEAEAQLREAQDTARKMEKYNAHLRNQVEALKRREGQASREDVAKLRQEIQLTDEAARQQKELFEETARGATQTDPNKAQALDNAADRIGAERTEMKELDEEYASLLSSGDDYF